MDQSSGTLADFYDALGGRARIIARIGVSKAALTNWLAAGQIPAHWFLAFEALAAEAGTSCPRRLFAFRGGEAAAAAEAAE